MILFGLILITTKVIDAANYGELSPIKLTAENVEVLNTIFETGEKDQLYDGNKDESITLKATEPSGKTIDFMFNMGQINCVNKLEIYGDPDTPSSVSATFTCTPSGCTCEPDSAHFCKNIFLSGLKITSTEALPEDLPEKTDCIYGDTTKLQCYTNSFSVREMTLTGYQPQAETDETDETEIEDSEEDCEKTYSCLSDAKSVAVAGVFPIVAVLRFI